MESLKGTILNYRSGPKTQNPKECILSFPNIKTVNEASYFIGKKVAWPVGDRKCRGKIISLHGRGGLVRARFKKGVPGKAIGNQVEIIG